MKGNFVWDLPDLKGSGSVPARDRPRRQRLAAVRHLDGVDRRRPTPSGFSYQNGGGNVNLTGSPDYGARIRIVGDPGSGCSSDPYRQFNTAAFQGPLTSSVGLESGNSYLSGCFAQALDLSIARNIRLGGSRIAATAGRPVQRDEPGRHHRPQHDTAAVESERSDHQRRAGLRPDHRAAEQWRQPDVHGRGEPRSLEAEERRVWRRQCLPGARATFRFRSGSRSEGSIPDEQRFDGV